MTGSERPGLGGLFEAAADRCGVAGGSARQNGGASGRGAGEGGDEAEDGVEFESRRDAVLARRVFCGT